MHLPALVLAIFPYLDLLVGRRPDWPELLLLLAIGALFLIGIFIPRAQAFGPVLCGPRPGPRPRIALTFDDGPDPETTPIVLEALGRERATFFVIAEKALAHPQLIAAMRAAGHQVCSHGIQHSWQLVLSPCSARKLVLGGIRSLKRLGIVEQRFFRSPYGLMTPPLMSILRRYGITTVGWSLRSWDSFHSGPVDEFARDLAGRASNGDILLLHDAPERPGGRRPLGIDATAALVRELRSRGFELVTVAQMHDGDTSENCIKQSRTRPLESGRKGLRRSNKNRRQSERNHRRPCSTPTTTENNATENERIARTS